LLLLPPTAIDDGVVLIVEEAHTAQSLNKSLSPCSSSNSEKWLLDDFRCSDDGSELSLTASTLLLLLIPDEDAATNDEDLDDDDDRRIRRRAEDRGG
jgi:hypothetical protein